MKIMLAYFGVAIAGALLMTPMVILITHLGQYLTELLEGRFGRRKKRRTPS